MLPNIDVAVFARHLHSPSDMTLSLRVAHLRRIPGNARRLATPAISEFRQKLSEGPSLSDFVSETPDRIVLGNTKG